MNEFLVIIEWIFEMCYFEECYMKVVILRDMKNIENDMLFKNVMFLEWKKMFLES